MHHQRRKSGHASGNTSMTDVRKVVTTTDLSAKHKTRPALSRRATPQAVQKLGKSPRDREKEWEEERFFEDERESFPQFCMTCEKQFLPQDERFLYCSEACRSRDQGSSTAALSPSQKSSSYITAANYPLYSESLPESRDIIPRASPSRPSSTHISPPATPLASGHTTAISALRSISLRPPSPPSPTVSYHPSIWPFTRSPAVSPSTSYSRPAKFFSSTYDTGYYGAASTNMDRPLPPRRPGVYSRPKSVELVTPMVGR